MGIDVFQIIKIAIFGIVLAILDKILESVGKKKLLLCYRL